MPYYKTYVKKAAPKKKSLLRKVSDSLKKAVKKVVKKSKPLVKKAWKKIEPHAKQFVKKHGAKALSSIGGYIGGPQGAAIGAGVGKIFGSGAYKITDNSILHGSQIPEFRSRRGNHQVRVKHRGFIADISGSQNFTNTSYNINPGNAVLFPYLSTQAAQYEEYKIHGLVFEFRTTAANSVGTTDISMGSVIMATEYNSTLPSYISKLQMENAEFSASCVPFDSMLHPVECKRSETVIGELYVRNSIVPTTQDQRLYDLGLFQVATVGQQAANKIGELWYSIDVSFYKERYGMSSGNDVVTAHYTATNPSTTNFFGTSQVQVAGSTFSLEILATTITFPNNMPNGNYLMTYTVFGGNATVGDPGLTFTNCNVLKYWDNDTVSQLSNNGAVNPGVYTLTLAFNIPATATGQAIISFSGGTLPTSTTWMDLLIDQVNYQVVG